MYKITVNDSQVLAITPDGEEQYLVDGKIVSPGIVEIRDGLFSIIINNKSHNAELLRHDAEEKTFYIRVNSNTYKVAVKDKFDVLLKELGLDALQSKKAADLKAPMPGMVVEVAVAEGQEVLKGDRLVVLEAMKMENILKAAADGVVKKINVKKGNTVEKNEVLILF